MGLAKDKRRFAVTNLFRLATEPERHEEKLDFIKEYPKIVELLITPPVLLDSKKIQGIPDVNNYLDKLQREDYFKVLKTSESLYNYVVEQAYSFFNAKKHQEEISNQALSIQPIYQEQPIIFLEPGLEPETFITMKNYFAFQWREYNHICESEENRWEEWSELTKFEKKNFSSLNNERYVYVSRYFDKDFDDIVLTFFDLEENQKVDLPMQDLATFLIRIPPEEVLSDPVVHIILENKKQLKPHGRILHRWLLLKELQDKLNSLDDIDYKILKDYIVIEAYDELADGIITNAGIVVDTIRNSTDEQLFQYCRTSLDRWLPQFFYDHFGRI